MNNSTRCLYSNRFVDFLSDAEQFVLGTLCNNYHGIVQSTQIEAWKSEIALLKNVLLSYQNENGKIIFEYDIPRLGKRIDVVLLLKGIIFCIEFKTGNKDALAEADVDQVLDYALDLTNFHKFSENRLIAPILIVSKYQRSSTVIQKSVYDENVLNPLISGETGLQELINKVIEKYPDFPSLEENWIISPYAPTPTIIEAARTLYENHSVEDITKHEADKVSTDATISCILDVIERSKRSGEKSICFVTGVPGAGKTLIGLEIAVRQTYQEHDKPVDDEAAVYLSGNGPLVAVLTEIP